MTPGRGLLQDSAAERCEREAQLRSRFKAVKQVEGLEVGLPRLLTRMSITELKVPNLRLGPDGAGRLAGVLGRGG